MPSSSSRSASSIVSVRPQAGSRYDSPQRVQSMLNSSAWKDLYPGGPKLWRRLMATFVTMALFGILFVILGAVFLDAARQIKDENNISLPFIWCIIGIVCGSFMVFCSLLLGKKMLPSPFRTAACQANNGTRPVPSNNSDSYRETFMASSQSRSSTVPSLVTEADLPPPYESPSGDNSTPSGNNLPITAVFIISQGDVTLALPADIQPPKYSLPGLVPPPKYSENDPLKLPNYDDCEVPLEVMAEHGEDPQECLQSSQLSSPSSVSRLIGEVPYQQCEVLLRDLEQLTEDIHDVAEDLQQISDNMENISMDVPNVFQDIPECTQNIPDFSQDMPEIS